MARDSDSREHAPLLLLLFFSCFDTAAPHAGTLLASIARSSFFATLLDGLSGKALKKCTRRGTL
ncbi:hypothetical protein D9M71_819600 [compost metagenome]